MMSEQVINCFIVRLFTGKLENILGIKIEIFFTVMMGVSAMPYKEKKNSVFAAPPLNIENKSNF